MAHSTTTNPLEANLSSTSEVRKKRGKLKIYLGMAAGVGKTYSMLSDARADLERGLDIVVGYVEPHGRVETESLLEGLPAVPPKQIEHRGVVLREFDLDEALRRRPAILLVDELAHSNAPGSRHTKRWQDVADLLEVGIDVRTTINIQHLESLRDLVAKSTGIFVQETVPDAFLENADEVELVDILPDELHQRLQEGKVYVPEKVDQALAGFFKKENLLALRELALRHTAERVDEEMRRLRSARSVEGAAKTKERILVCIAPNRMAPRVIREAKRLSTNLHADLLAVSVESPRQGNLSEKARSDMAYAIELAKNLGAQTTTLAADDIVQELLRFAAAHRVTTIVVGKPIRARWREILFGSVVDTLIRASGEIDVLVITGAEEAGTPLIIRRSHQPTPWTGYAAAITVVAVCTGLGFLMHDRFDPANIVMVYLLGVAFVASRLGRNESILASILSVSAFDVSFVPPRGTFAVSDVQYLITFGIMLVVSYLIGTLTHRLRDQNLASAERERSTAALYELGRDLGPLITPEEIASAGAAKVSQLMEAPVAIFEAASAGAPKVLQASANAFEAAPNELAVAAWVCDHDQPAGRTTQTLAGASALYLPLISSLGCLGAVGIHLDKQTFIDPARTQMLNAMAQQIAGALERCRLSQAARQATLDIETERLRSDLLSSVSHDLRTPLASIEGAADILAGQSQGRENDRELAATIREEAQRLGRLVRNLLDMTRVEGGGIDLNLDWYTLEELIGNAVRQTAPLFTTPTRVLAQPDTPLVRVDGVLVQQVFVNLLENASRHAGPRAVVTITVGFDSLRVWVDVADNGPGILPADRERVFRKFEREGTAGFGLGLTICRAIMLAHGGKIEVVDSDAGANFRLSFVRSPEPEEES